MMLTGVLAMGRTMAESLLTETVTVGVTVDGAFDESTGTYPKVFQSHDAGRNGDGRARVKFPTLTVSERTPGGQTIAVQDVMLGLPVGFAGAVRVGDDVTVIGSDVDPDMVGRVFRVKGLAQSGAVTLNRFPLESN